MPKVIFHASDREKALWVEASHDERVSLSEWLRRAANERLGNGGLGAAGISQQAGPTVPERPVPAAPSPRLPLREHKADPKSKAAQEHGPRERTSVKGLCPHRVPLGSFCKRCEETA